MWGEEEIIPFAVWDFDECPDEPPSPLLECFSSTLMVHSLAIGEGAGLPATLITESNDSLPKKCESSCVWNGTRNSSHSLRHFLDALSGSYILIHSLYAPQWRKISKLEMQRSELRSWLSQMTDLSKFPLQRKGKVMCRSLRCSSLEKANYRFGDQIKIGAQPCSAYSCRLITMQQRLCGSWKYLLFGSLQKKSWDSYSSAVILSLPLS